MTRFLSQALRAEEPVFSQTIQQLEQAAGRPSADIRLTADIAQRTRQKIVELGLDPSDTTGPELYSALHERLKQDEQQLRAALNIAEDASPAAIIARVQQCLDKVEISKQCFAMKSNVAKRLLKAKPPRRAMKQLGYRSLDSLLKHESAAQLYAAAVMSETSQWQRHLYEQYAALSPSDFEPRQMTVISSNSKRWAALSSRYTLAAKHNVLSFKELGAVVLLPHDQPLEGLTITTFLLALEAMNDIRAYSSFARLQQVKANFGTIIQESCTGEPFVAAQLAGQPVPWRAVQRFYARFKHSYHPEVFEPHVQSEDLEWIENEKVLATLAPALAFWQDTSCLAMLHEGEAVSLNALDVALGVCNNLSFADRIVHFVRDNLWHEIIMQYLHEENLEEAVHRQLSADLVEAPEEALAD